MLQTRNKIPGCEQGKGLSDHISDCRGELLPFELWWGDSFLWTFKLCHAHATAFKEANPLELRNGIA